MPTSIGIVDDHPLIRRGLAVTLADEQMSVLWTVGSLADGIEHAIENTPDVIVVDLVLGSDSGLELIRTLKPRMPQTRFLVATMMEERHYAVRCYKAGASGFVSKACETSELVDGIRCIANGAVKFSPQVTTQLLDQSEATTTEEAVLKLLSDRELQVLELIGSGKTTREIADAVFVSPKTIETFRERIKRKLKIKNATELAHFATRWVVSTQESVID